MNNNTIAQELWGVCDILRDGGITDPQYVTELTLLLFLKMAQETSTEHRMPPGNRRAARPGDARGKRPELNPPQDGSESVLPCRMS